MGGASPIVTGSSSDPYDRLRQKKHIVKHNLNKKYSF